MKKPRSKILVVITTKRKIQIQKQNGHNDSNYWITPRDISASHRYPRVKVFAGVFSYKSRFNFFMTFPYCHRYSPLPDCTAPKQGISARASLFQGDFQTRRLCIDF